MYGIDHPVIGLYLPWVGRSLERSGANQLPGMSQRGLGFHTVRGGIYCGDFSFRLCLLELQTYKGIYDKGMGAYRPRAGLAFFLAPANQRSAGGAGIPHRAGRYPRGVSRFSSRAVRVVGVWRHFLCIYNYYNPGKKTESVRVSLALALFPSPSQSAIGRWGWVFHTVRGDIDLGFLGSRPRGGAGFSTPCVAISTWDIWVFVPGLLEL